MELTLNKLLKLLTKNIIFILVTSILFTTGAFFISKVIIKPKYSAYTKMYAYQEDDDKKQNNNSTANLSELNYLQKIVNTYIEMLDTNLFFEKVQAKSNLNYTASQLDNMIKFSVVKDTAVFQITVTASTPNEAKLISDCASEAAVETISNIKKSTTIKVVDPALTPKSPSSPNIALNIVIGLILGLIISIIIVILKDMFDIKIKSEDELSERYNIPILGCVPIIENYTQNQMDRR